MKKKITKYLHIKSLNRHKRQLVSFVLVLVILVVNSPLAYAATFTPGMAKRDAPGPFAGGVMVQGKYDGTGTSDALTASVGTNISGFFNSNADSHQGSVVLWITPEWNGNDGLRHVLFTDNSSIIRLEKLADNTLVFKSNGTTLVTVSISSWVAGTTYNLTARWDNKTPIGNVSGTDYHASISINDSHAYGRTSTWTTGNPTTLNIGSDPSNTLSANALIEGLTIYRRPLYDGTTGIDVGNGDEIAQIYNSGSGRDPTLITGSWDVVFALPTNSSTGALTSGTGNAWSHPHSSNLLYTSTTNTGGFMMNGTYTSDGWALENNSLTTSLNAYWKLDEASGSRADSAGSNTLTDNNTVTQATGKLTNAAQFTAANSEYLSITDNATLSTGDIDFSIAGWVYLDSKTDQRGVISKWMPSTNQREYMLEYGTNDRFNFFVSNDGANFTQATANSFGSPSTGTWYFIAAWHDSSANTINIQINNGTVNSTAHTTGVFDGTAEFKIGTRLNASTEKYMDGRIDGIGFWKKVLSSSERTALYNSGNGLDHSFVSSTALSSTEKIYGGGYKHTSYAANQGIYYDETVTTGADWVVRALAHSDGTSIPKIILYDQTNGAEIGSLTGTATSTRTDPDVFIFTGEAPAGMTTLRVKLVNTKSSGTTYWHQVEVLPNLITNPSMETGSGDPWTPTGWENNGGDTGDFEEELTTVHSGSTAVQINSSAGTNDNLIQRIGGTSGTFLSFGGFSYGTGSSGVNLYDNASRINFQHGAQVVNFGMGTAAQWNHAKVVGRLPENGQLRPGIRPNGSGPIFVDNIYFFQLNPVSLTVTPASLANSTENGDEIRIDGRDTYVASSGEAVSMGTTTGYTSFNYRPRHAAADAVKFAETTADDAYVVSFNGDADDYIRVYWDSANTLRMSYSMAGATGTGTWDATGAIAANTEYPVSLSYTGGGNMILNVGGTDRITLSGIPAAFGTAPNTVYFGSDTNGANQGDATFSALTFDNDAPSISLTALNPDPNNDNTPTLTGTATEAIGTVASVQFQMDGTGGSWTACTADDGSFDEADEDFSCTTSTLVDGSHTMYVRATDSNGNTTGSGDYETDTFTIDATAPTVSVTPLSPDPTSDTTPSITGTVTDATTALTAIEFQMDSTAGSWTACTANDGAIDELSEAFTCTPSTLSEGSHTIYIRGTDSATNTTALANYGTDTFTVDSGAPTLSLTAISPDPGTDTTPTLTGTATDATGTIATVEFQIDSTTGSWTACTPTDGTFGEGVEDFTCTVTTDLSDGEHTIYVWATDDGSNTSANVSDTFTIDTTAAAKGDLDYPASGSYINQERPTFKWKVFADETTGVDSYDLEIDFENGEGFTINDIPADRSSTYNTNTYTARYDDDYVSVTTRSSSSWSSNENDGKLREGEVTWKIIATDNAGNTVSSSKTFYADFTPPLLSNLQVQNLGIKESYLISTDLTPDITGTILDNLRADAVEFSFYKQNFFLGIETSRSIELLDNLTITDTARNTAITFSYSPSQNLNYGKYMLEIVGIDKATNKSVVQSFPLQFISADQARLLFRDDPEKLDEVKESSGISLPELEKQARIKKEVEAAELQKLLDTLRSYAATITGGISNFFADSQQFLAGLFDFELKIDLSDEVLALNNLRLRIKAQSLKAFNTMASRVTTIYLSVYHSIKDTTPRYAQNVLDTYTAFSNTVTAGLQRSQRDVKTQLATTQSESNLAVATLFWSLNSLSSQANLSAALTQSAVQQQVEQAYADTAVSAHKIGDGAKYAYYALSKPITKSKGFGDRIYKGTKIAISTFHTYVFDGEPTRISNVTLEEIGRDYVVISWETNHYTTNNKINYGEDLSYGEEVWLDDGEKFHQIRIANLKPDTRYFFEVMSLNKNYTFDAYYSFTTVE